MAFKNNINLVAYRFGLVGGVWQQARGAVYTCRGVDDLG